MKKIIASPHAPKAVGPYSQAVEAGGALYVSGQLPIDGATSKMDEGVEAQTHRSLTNLRHILEEGGWFFPYKRIIFVKPDFVRSDAKILK